jgi:hypothetical protein
MKPPIFVAIGKRGTKQAGLFISKVNPVAGPGHLFYTKPNEVLAASGFDDFVEKLCVSYYYW